MWCISHQSSHYFNPSFSRGKNKFFFSLVGLKKTPHRDELYKQLNAVNQQAEADGKESVRLRARPLSTSPNSQLLNCSFLTQIGVDFLLDGWMENILVIPLEAQGVKERTGPSRLQRKHKHLKEVLSIH